MSEIEKKNQMQTCPQCDNHCPVDALQCGRGRKYFGAADGAQDQAYEHEHGEHGHGHGGHGHAKSGLAGLFHRCGHFMHHAQIEETELFQALTDEEKATLQALLEKLSADWQNRFGGNDSGRSGHGHHGHGDEGHHHVHERQEK